MRNDEKIKEKSRLISKYQPYPFITIVYNEMFYHSLLKLRVIYRKKYGCLIDAVVAADKT